MGSGNTKRAWSCGALPSQKLGADLECHMGRATRRKERTLPPQKRSVWEPGEHAFWEAGYSRTLVLVSSPGRKYCTARFPRVEEERTGHLSYGPGGRCDS